MSNSPWAGTGYGVQTAEVVPRIKRAGHDIAIAANYGHFGLIIEWDEGIRLYPASRDQALNDTINATSAHFNADWVISLYDTWTMQREMWPERVASWVPIDHQPAPPEVVAWCREVTPIAMSRFGHRMLTEQGIDSTYIPHSVNTAVFKPTPSDMRQQMGIPEDAFLVMVAAANKGISPPRKAWGEMFDSLGYFLREHPDAWVYLHTDRNVSPPAGVDLNLLAKQVGLDENRLRWTDPYLTLIGQVKSNHLAALYSAADVLLASSMGEGFGVPVIEAQACGLPVIVSDFSAQPELCASGWLVQGQPWHDVLQGNTAFFTPYVPSIIRRLNEARDAKGDQSIRDKAVEFASEYDTDKVFDRYWVPFLNQLEAMLPKQNRAERRRQKKRRAA